ncbi:DUF418 domain-containing protein [Pseudonocardia nematodicida]|uniref:DUF418 domain-containing protein n=1 Tax=Pseudonocardia nematodicida TaxID=1206997 RepID=A0ABV1KEN6_9PSEU
MPGRAVADRSPAPDLARGAVLLLIAVANAHTFVTDRGIGVRGYPRDLTGADGLVAAVQLVFVDGRAYPMFALLFGYGAVTLARRRATGDPDEGAALVRRRGLALFAIGAAHAVLLWSGDVVAAYGLLAVLLAGLLVRGSTTALVATAAGTVTVACLLHLPVALTDADVASSSPSLVEPSVFAAAADRFGEWLFGYLPVNALALAGAVAAGVLLARAGWLDDPVRHRRPLTWLAAAGAGAGIAGGLPLALVAAGVWTPSLGPALLAGGAHAVSGYAAGAGYAAIAGLVAGRWARSGSRTTRAGAGSPGTDAGASSTHATVPIPVSPAAGAHTPAGAGPGPVGRALLATGQRSLSAYLAQSVAFVALFPAWTLGLGSGLPVWAATLCGIGVWLVSVLVAAASARAGWRGPAEVALRRLTDGRGRAARRPDAPEPG